jgi:hypothetical protein
VFYFYLQILFAARSSCSAAQELTTEQLENLLPPCNSGLNCFISSLEQMSQIPCHGVCNI